MFSDTVNAIVTFISASVLVGCYLQLRQPELRGKREKGRNTRS